MFPAEPFEPSYRANQRDDPEASPLLTAERPQGASEEEFTSALDRERNKVIEFYKETEGDLLSTFKTILGEVRVLEEREFQDVIQEEDEDEEGMSDREAQGNSGFRSSQDGGLEEGASRPSGTLARRSSYAPPSPQANGYMKTLHNRFFSSDPHRDDADLLEASLTPQVQQETRARSRSNARRARMSRTGTSSDQGRRTSDELRRMSASSASSGGLGPAASLGRYRGNLGLIPMSDPTPLSDSIFSSAAAAHSAGGPRLSGEDGEGIDYIWTASSDYGKVLRIGFKKRIARMWLDGFALKGYVDLNMTAFEKILKK
jgi:phosphate transporter